MRTMLQDLRYAIRQIQNAPGFAITVVVTVALGIGANTAVFSVIKAVLLNQLPYRPPNCLAVIAESTPNAPRPVPVDFTTTHDLRARSRSFESMSLNRGWSAALAGKGDIFAPLGYGLGEPFASRGSQHLRLIARM